MHIRFSEGELQTLIQMLSLAMNVAAWNRQPTSQPFIQAFANIDQKVLGKAVESGQGNGIEFNEEAQAFQMTEEAQDASFFAECYDEFKSESFWEELAIRLSDRDMIKSLGKTAWEKLNEKERRVAAAIVEKRYWKEFSKHGIERLLLIHPPEEG